MNKIRYDDFILTFSLLICWTNSRKKKETFTNPAKYEEDEEKNITHIFLWLFVYKCGCYFYFLQVLSVCSPYFQKIFLEHPSTHPILFMTDVNSNHMAGLLDFMYSGQVRIVFHYKFNFPSFKKNESSFLKKRTSIINYLQKKFSLFPKKKKQFKSI